MIPGNHDIGFFGEEADLPRRLDAFRATWGDDRFVRDLAGWRLVGADAYLLGTADHDDWLREAVTTTAPVLVFVHQPIRGDPADGWEMPDGARAAFARATAGADVRVVASGHRHCSFHRRAGRVGAVADADRATTPSRAPIRGPGSSSTSLTASGGAPTTGSCARGTLS